jgi:hypothetical protein
MRLICIYRRGEKVISEGREGMRGGRGGDERRG